jgi:hypothetical protein
LITKQNEKKPLSHDIKKAKAFIDDKRLPKDVRDYLCTKERKPILKLIAKGLNEDSLSKLTEVVFLLRMLEPDQG